MIAKVALGTGFALLVAANSALAESGGQTILLNQIGALQQEVMELRGLTEQQANTMEQIQKELSSILQPTLPRTPRITQPTR